MSRIFLLLCSASLVTSPVAVKGVQAAEPTVKDDIACYNVITGRTFSSAECDIYVCRGTDGSGRRFPGIKIRHSDGYGPCIRMREEGENNKEIDCKFGPGFLASRGKPVQAFSSPACAEAKIEFRQCLNGWAPINIRIAINLSGQLILPATASIVDAAILAVRT